MKTQVLRPIRCAIYTRKSTEEGLDQDYNSLAAQYDAAEAYIRSQVGEGWVLVEDDYSDAAISGGTMERPALKRLLNDVEGGKVDMVVVYKIDRLSRSLLDFATIAKLLENHGAGFVSVTEKFDTSSAIGKLHLNIILSFAQFERELASERIRDKVAASKKKGLWMGGHPPLGYDVEDRKLVVNRTEAATIRDIFKRFSIMQSVIHLVSELQAEGVTTKTFYNRKGELRHGKPITPSVLHYMLRNPVYIGKVSHKGNLYDGQHDAIISMDLWEDVQSVFKETPRRCAKSNHTDTASPLNGLVTCGRCECAMTHTFTRKKEGKIYRYYSPSAKRRQLCKKCPVGTLPAAEVEGIVFDYLRELAMSPDIMLKIWQALSDNGLEFSEHQIRERLENFGEIYDQLFPVEQYRLVNLFIEKVELNPGNCEIHLRHEGLDAFIEELKDITPDQKKEKEHGDTYAIEDHTRAERRGYHRPYGAEENRL